MTDITGQRFGKLVVIEKVCGYPSYSWKCKCDCGNTKVVRRGNLTSGKSRSCGCLYANAGAKVVIVIGGTFGKLTVIAQCESNPRGDSRWLCECSCGRVVKRLGGSIRRGFTLSCGCNKGWHRQDLLGKKFGRLLVVEGLGSVKGRGTRWKCECECGAIVKTYTTELNNGHTKSCGCYHSDVSSRVHSGENNVNWNGGTTAPLIKERGSRRYKAWRNGVFARDDYTCQRCSTKGGYLHAHHMSGFAECEIKRYLTSNGVTLCRDCHYEFHRWYGHRGSTESKTIEFLSNQKHLAIAL